MLEELFVWLLDEDSLLLEEIFPALLDDVVLELEDFSVKLLDDAFTLDELLTVLLDENFFESVDDGDAQIIFPQSSREYS